MTKKTVRAYDSKTNESIDVSYVQNPDGSFSQELSVNAGPSTGLTDQELRADPILVDNLTLGDPSDAAIITDISGSLSGKIRGMIKLLVNKITVKLDPGENYIGVVGSRSVAVGSETTRPDDVVPYSAGDVISGSANNSDLAPFNNLALGRLTGGSGYIMKMRLSTDQKLCVSSIRVHLYTVSGPPSAIAGDNTPMDLFYLNKAVRIGHVDMPAFGTAINSSGSTMAVSQDVTSHIKYKCGNGDLNIYYVLETLLAFTPISGQKFYLEVLADQD